jgi:hypothetical protein
VEFILTNDNVLFGNRPASEPAAALAADEAMEVLWCVLIVLGDVRSL